MADSITGRGSSCRPFRLSALALQACVLLMAGGGCTRSDEPEAVARDEHAIRAPMPPDSVAATVESVIRVPAPPADSVAAAVPSVTRLPAPPPEELTPAEPDAITSETDAALFATPEDLEELSAGLIVPVEGVERSELRDTYEEARGGRVHEALDIMAARGTPVLSAADGRVLRLFDSRPGGLMVYAADTSGRFILLYGHLDGYAAGLRDGMPLRRGQVIGYVGTTGNAAADAPHLHFGILRGNPGVSWSEGIPVNPYPLLVPAGGGR